MAQTAAVCRRTCEEEDLVKWLMGRWIHGFEREWDYDSRYLRDMLEVSPRAAWLLLKRAEGRT
jgi:hypothetical protein